MAAEQLLDNPLLQESLQAQEMDLLSQIKAVRLDDKESHTRLVMAMQMTHAVSKHLWLLIQDGQVAADQINVRGKRID